MFLCISFDTEDCYDNQDGNQYNAEREISGQFSGRDATNIKYRKEDKGSSHERTFIFESEQLIWGTVP